MGNSDLAPGGHERTKHWRSMSMSSRLFPHRQITTSSSTALIAVLTISTLVCNAQPLTPTHPLTRTPSEEVAPSTKLWFTDLMTGSELAVLNVSMEGLARNLNTRPLYEAIKSNRGFRQTYGVSAADIRDMAMIVHGNSPFRSRLVIRTRSPISIPQLIDSKWLKVEPRIHKGMPYWVAKDRAYFLPDSRTLAIDSEADIRSQIEREPGFAPKPPSWTQGLEGKLNGLIYGGVDMRALAAYSREHPSVAKELSDLAPLLQNATAVCAHIVIDDQLAADFLVKVRDSQNSQRVQTEMVKAIEIFGKSLGSGTEPFGVSQYMEALLTNPKELGRSTQFKLAHDAVEAKLSCQFDVTRCRRIVALIQNLLRFEGSRANRQSLDKLKEHESAIKLDAIAMGMMKYYKQYGHFPPATVYGTSGIPHSWRVALLPYLEEQDLYEQYNLNEPWDSPNNRRLLMQSPEYFRAPDEKPDSPNSSYFVRV